jgi:di/tricarboxylate transporter
VCVVVGAAVPPPPPVGVVVVGAGVVAVLVVVVVVVCWVLVGVLCVGSGAAATDTVFVPDEPQPPSASPAHSPSASTPGAPSSLLFTLIAPMVFATAFRSPRLGERLRAASRVAGTPDAAQLPAPARRPGGRPLTNY